MANDPDPADYEALFADIEGILTEADEQMEDVTDFSTLSIPELIKRRNEAARELEELGDLKRIQIGLDPLTDRGRELASYHTAIAVALSHRGIE